MSAVKPMRLSFNKNMLPDSPFKKRLNDVFNGEIFSPGKNEYNSVLRDDMNSIRNNKWEQNPPINEEESC